MSICDLLTLISRKVLAGGGDCLALLLKIRKRRGQGKGTCREGAPRVIEQEGILSQDVRDLRSVKTARLRYWQNKLT